MASALRLLPTEQRETLLMRFVDDMTLQEIADALNIPLGTVKSRLHHALKTLRENGHIRRHFDEV
ncbi:MAG: sigma-70 family RNA polymerase sigma factor [Planctomycetes bacterium]|nr:sigma-70 family RNA polymerase sigma factor [Planctomycetota bacterium]